MANTRNLTGWNVFLLILMVAIFIVFIFFVPKIAASEICELLVGIGQIIIGIIGMYVGYVSAFKQQQSRLIGVANMVMGAVLIMTAAVAF